MKTTTKDVPIILRDANINYCGQNRDCLRKEEIPKLPVALFCIHGNHEQRPEKQEAITNLSAVGESCIWKMIFRHCFFDEDGEIHDIAGYRTIVIGGAYSVDKNECIARHLRW